MGTLPPPPALPPLTPEELEAKEEVGEVADTAAGRSGFGIGWQSLMRGKRKGKGSENSFFSHMSTEYRKKGTLNLVRPFSPCVNCIWHGEFFERRSCKKREHSQETRTTRRLSKKRVAFAATPESLDRSIDPSPDDDDVDEILGTDPAAVSLATTRVRARFSDLSRSFSAFSFGICCSVAKEEE